ncbi:MAG TPA: histidine kinase dimerization/phospho-acceptor domain-containing protein [Thermotogota bacterium]|nr:histidine kinase dimerization/phospho-acceptor domain-containing protein [Thermotogota bacterium]
MKKRTVSFRKEIFRVMSYLFLTFFVMIGCLLAYVSYRNAHEDIYKSSDELAVSIGNNVDQFIGDINGYIITMSESIDNQISRLNFEDDMAKGLMLMLLNNSNIQIKANLSTFLNHHENIESISVFDKEGLVLMSLPEAVNGHTVVHSVSEFTQLNSDKPLWSDVYISPETGQPELSVSVIKENFIMVMNINLKALNDMLLGINQDSHISLHDSNGKFITGTKENKLKTGVDSSDNIHIKTALVGKKFVGYFFCKMNSEKQEMLGTSLPLQNGWIVTVFKPSGKALWMVSFLGYTYTFALIITFFLGFFTIRYFSRRMLKPVNSLVEWSDKLADGNYDKDFDIHSYEELNKLVESFKGMSRNVEERENELYKQNEVLASYSVELATINRELVESEKKANQSSQAKSEFLANMSHEFRTPLNGIMGFSELLKSSKLNQEQISYIDNVIHSSHHLLGLVNDVLDFSNNQGDGSFGKYDIMKYLMERGVSLAAYKTFEE